MKPWREGSVYKPCGQAVVGDQVRFWGEWHEIDKAFSMSRGRTALRLPSLDGWRWFRSDERRWFREPAA